ncbi:MAG: hypothetical protein JRI23_33120 [Deltaproteobacteria bacterium]|nr:hypothetical protein [Deltaproteobacteria bacterium]MBW2537096.1 hypothetical protein [Deltaproteobacteria bacterium]
MELPEARAQEIQLTGPLAGAPAVRRLRLYREGRFEIAPAATFTLLDEYRRSIAPSLRATYHFFDWFGVGLFGGYFPSYNTSLADELQEKAIDARNCEANPNSLPCKRTAVSLCRGADCLASDQLGRLQFMIAPQVTFIPFRGKLALFSELFLDTDISVFVGGAIIGVQERADCEIGSCPDSFGLETKITGAPTFGLGLNFYPTEYLGFGTEFRGTPFAWNTSGFDNAGKDPDGDFPDDAVNSDDRAFHFNPMLTVYVSVMLPTEVGISD